MAENELLESMVKEIGMRSFPAGPQRDEVMRVAGAVLTRRLGPMVEAVGKHIYETENGTHDIGGARKRIESYYAIRDAYRDAMEETP